MVEAAELFRDFAVVLVAAGGAALLFHYLRQPVVLGYLLAGFIVGPFSPGPSFVGDAQVMEFLGAIGIAFLLFALGLEFNVRRLLKVGAGVAVAGIIETLGMMALGFWIGRLMGWDPMPSLFLGAVMSISSTTIVVKLLAERGDKDQEWAQTAFGLLIMEDILAVLILTALGTAGATGDFHVGQITGLVSRLGLFLGAALLLGLVAAPRIVDRLALLKTPEVTVILTAGIGMGMALLAAELGFSPGLGAFVAGALLAESPKVERLAHRIEPLRDVFTAIFFVTVGAALDPATVARDWRLILVVAAAVIVGKVALVSLGSFIGGARPSTAMRVGMTLAQVGEFGFIIAALGIGLGAADARLYGVAVAVCDITAFTTPYLIRTSPFVVAAIGRRLPTGLHAFLAVYGSWLKRASGTKGDPLRRDIRIHALTAVLAGAALAGVFLLGTHNAAFVQGVLAWVLPEGWASGWAAGWGVWAVVGLAASPFAFLLVREVNEIVDALAKLAVPRRLRSADATSTEHLLRRTFGLVAWVGLGLGAVFAASFVVQNVVYAALASAIGIVAGSLLLGRSLGRFHREVERTVGQLAQSAGVSQAEALHVVEHTHAWGASSRRVHVPAIGGGADRAIGQLRIRELTGAGIAQVRRAGRAIMNPNAGHVLRPGDSVLLIGETDAVMRGAEILLGRDLGITGGATEFPIPDGSPLVGRKAADMRLSEGLLLLAVRRDGAAIALEGLTLRPGDVLVVSGPQEAVDRLAGAV